MAAYGQHDIMKESDYDPTEVLIYLTSMEVTVKPVGLKIDR